MKIAWLSPLPPVRSGIAGYSMMLLPEIARLAEVTAVVSQEDVYPAPGCPVIGIDELEERRPEFDVVVCQLGNNIHHEYVWREARAHPSVIVLHELVLHHLITEMTLARGNPAEYIALLKECEGVPGEAFARGRAAGHHFEIGNFFFPASAALASNARAVIVHNEWARSRLLESGVRTPVRVIDHPLDRLKAGEGRATGEWLRREHGFPPDCTIIGVFGFVTMPKRPAVVFEAFSNAYRENPELRLLIVGESAPDIDLPALGRSFDLPDKVWSSTGWTSDQQFDQALLAVDRVVSLRYPSAGESSGAIARIFGAGKPLAVTDYAQFADLPEEIVVKIPLGAQEVEHLVRFMTEDLDVERIETGQKRWIETHGNPRSIAAEYLDVLEESLRLVPERVRERPAYRSNLNLRPTLAVESFSAERRGGVIGIDASIRNRGMTTIRSSSWGEPAYRVIVKLMKEGHEVTSEWWPLQGDLGPGEAIEVSGTLRGVAGDSIHLVHGLVGIPVVDETPFFTGEVAR